MIMSPAPAEKRRPVPIFVTRLSPSATLAAPQQHSQFRFLRNPLPNARLCRIADIGTALAIYVLRTQRRFPASAENIDANMPHEPGALPGCCQRKEICGWEPSNYP